VTIRTQLSLTVGVLVIAIVLVSAGELAATYKYSTEVSAFSRLAGRLQTLSQQVAKEALLYAQTRDAAAGAGLGKSADEFALTLAALTDGGAVAMGDDAGTETITAVNDGLAHALAKQTGVYWGEMDRAIHNLSAAGGGDPAALDYIVRNTPVLSRSVTSLGNRLTGLIVERARHMMIVQALILLFSLAAGLITTIIGTRISKSIEDLTAHADAISQGQSDEPVPTNGPGEVGKLGKSLDRMRISLNKAMKMLQG
jgi:HAMP domain-containing protein